MKFKLIVTHLISKLNNQGNSQGFTLIELLVAIMLIGILSAVALPNLITQVGKAREAEAKKTLSSIGQAQQAYSFEKGTFADDIAKLDIVVGGNYYAYPNPSAANANIVKHQATSVDSSSYSTRNYSLGVYNNSGQFSLVLCQSTSVGGAAEAPNTFTDPCINGTRIQ